MADKVNKIPEAFIHFDLLPDDALVDDKVTALVYGCTRNTVWRRARAGGIWPKPIKISPQQTRFRVGDIRSTLAALRAA